MGCAQTIRLILHSAEYEGKEEHNIHSGKITICKGGNTHTHIVMFKEPTVDDDQIHMVSLCAEESKTKT